METKIHSKYALLKRDTNKKVNAKSHLALPVMLSHVITRRLALTYELDFVVFSARRHH